MDSKSIIERMKDVHLLKSDEPAVWSKLTDEFPYFAGAQWLNYGCQSFHEKADKKFIRLYISEPLEFLRYEDRLKKQPVILMPPSKKEEPITPNLPASTIDMAKESKEISPVEAKFVKEDKSLISGTTVKPKEISSVASQAINSDNSPVGKQIEKPKEMPRAETKAVKENIPSVDKKTENQNKIPSIEKKSQEMNSPLKTEKTEPPQKETSKIIQSKETTDTSEKVQTKPTPVQIRQEEKKVASKPENEIKAVQDIRVKESINIDTKLQDTEPVVVKQNEDILELINELPNSSPFKIPDLSETSVKTTQETLELEDKSKPFKKEARSISKIDSDEEDKSLMVVMSFTEWLNHFKHKTEIEKKEAKEKKALKAAWQKEKLAEAADEELEEIPEPLFKQAMESISMESTLISESLAIILAKQGKRDKAISMYKKLSLRNPEKSTYFADRINELNLNIE